MTIADRGLEAACENIARGTLRGIDWLNYFLADVQTGVGPFLAIYLAGVHWNERDVGVALMVGGLAGIVMQTPAGELVDRLRAKRALIAGAVVALVVGVVIIACFPTFWPVMAGQILVGGPSSVFIPAIAAISMGMVGSGGFDRRQGRNQMFNAAGNVTAAAAMGAIAYYVSNRGIFFFIAASAIPTLIALRCIRPTDIDHDVARGCSPGKSKEAAASFRTLLADRRLMVFLACCVLFHFANAAMLPLVGEMLSKGKGRSSMLFMSACVITTQLVITLTALPLGRMAGSVGRKPLLVLGFAALLVRGLLYLVVHQAAGVVAIQVLDGVDAGIFNVVSVLVIADLTRGTGRFNVAQGAIATAVAIGSSLSQGIAGSIVHVAGYGTGFLFLSGVAGAALGLLVFCFPETGRGGGEVPATA